MSHVEYSAAAASSKSALTDLPDGDDDTWLYGNDGVDTATTTTNASSLKNCSSGSTTYSDSGAKFDSSSQPLSTVSSMTTTSRPVVTTSNLDDYGQPDDTFHDEDNTLSNTTESKNTAAEANNDPGGGAGSTDATQGLFLSDEAFNYDDQMGGTPLQDNGDQENTTDGVVDYKRTDSMAEESEPTPTNDDDDAGAAAAQNQNNGDAAAQGEEDEDEDEDDDDDDGFKVNIVLDNIVTKPFSAQSAAGAPNAFGRQQSKPGAGPAAAPGTANTAAGAGAKPRVDLDAPGFINDLPTYEFNIDGISEEEKPWRKPGADITDYFNYGFSEETWVAYCVKQKRQRAENANLKSTVQMLNQQNSSGYSHSSGLNTSFPSGGSNSSMNGSSGPLQPIQVNNGKMNPGNQYQARPPFYRPPLQSNQRPPFGMFSEPPIDMSHQPSFVQPPPILDLSAPPPGWATGPPPSIVPPIMGQQQQTPQTGAGMMNRMPPQQRMMTPGNQPQMPIMAQNPSAGFHTAPPAQFNNPPGAFQYPPPMMSGSNVVNASQVNIPPPNTGFGFHQPPPTMQFPRTGANQASTVPGQLPLLQHPPPAGGTGMNPTWEKPPTIDQQQSQYFDPTSLKSPTKTHSQSHRNSRSPTPGVQSPSHASTRSPNSLSTQHQPSESSASSMGRYQSANKLDMDSSKPASGSYKPRSGDYGRSDARDYDREHRDRDRRSPSSPRHRHRHHERRDGYERRDHRDRERSRSRERSPRDRDRSRSREDRYSKRSRKKSEEDDYYRSKQSSSSSSASLSKRPKKSSRSDRDGASSERVLTDASKMSQAPPVTSTN